MRLLERLKTLEQIFDNAEIESIPNFKDWSDSDLNSYICSNLNSEEDVEGVLSLMVEKKYISPGEVTKERKSILKFLEEQGKQI